MSVAELRNLFDEARPLVKQWLDLSEQFAAFRDAATEKGFDWSQIKALLKAQTQDERDGGNEHVKKIIERAEFASSYAAQLGLINENKYSDEPVPAAPVKAAATESEAPHVPSKAGAATGATSPISIVARASAEPATEAMAGGEGENPARDGASASPPYPGDDDPLGPDLPACLWRHGIL